MSTREVHVSDEMVEKARAREAREIVLEVSRPFVKLKCDIINVSLPTIYVREDGSFEHIYSAEVQAQLAQVEELRKEAVASALRKFTGTRLGG